MWFKRLFTAKSRDASPDEVSRLMEHFDRKAFRDLPLGQEWIDISSELATNPEDVTRTYTGRFRAGVKSALDQLLSGVDLEGSKFRNRRPRHERRIPIAGLYCEVKQHNCSVRRGSTPRERPDH